MDLTVNILIFNWVPTQVTIVLLQSFGEFKTNTFTTGLKAMTRHQVY